MPCIQQWFDNNRTNVLKSPMTVTGPRRAIDHASLPGKVKESFAKQSESSGRGKHWTKTGHFVEDFLCCLMVSSFGCMISWHYHVHHSCDQRSWGMNPYYFEEVLISLWMMFPNFMNIYIYIYWYIHRDPYFMPPVSHPVHFCIIFIEVMYDRRSFRYHCGCHFFFGIDGWMVGFTSPGNVFGSISVECTCLREKKGD